MEANVNGMKEEMKKMRGEMRQIGRGLQAGMARIVAVARGRSTDNGRQNGAATCCDQRAEGECTGG